MLVTFANAALDAALGPLPVTTIHDSFLHACADRWATDVMTGPYAPPNPNVNMHQYGCTWLFREWYRTGNTLYRDGAKRIVQRFRDDPSNDFPSGTHYSPDAMKWFYTDGRQGANLGGFHQDFNDAAPEQFTAWLHTFPGDEAAASVKMRDIVLHRGPVVWRRQRFLTPVDDPSGSLLSRGIRETACGVQWLWNAVLNGDGATQVLVERDQFGVWANASVQSLFDRTYRDLVEGRDAAFVKPHIPQWYYLNLFDGFGPVWGLGNQAAIAVRLLCMIDRWNNGADPRLFQRIQQWVTEFDQPTGQRAMGQWHVNDPYQNFEGGSFGGTGTSYYYLPSGNYTTGYTPGVLIPVTGHQLIAWAYMYWRTGNTFYKQRVRDMQQGIINAANSSLSLNDPTFISGQGGRQVSEALDTWLQAEGFIELRDGGGGPPPEPPVGTCTLTGASSVQGAPNQVTPLTASVSEVQYIACRFSIISGPNVIGPSEMDPEIAGSGPYVFSWSVDPRWTPAGTYQLQARARRNSGTTVTSNLLGIVVTAEPVVPPDPAILAVTPATITLTGPVGTTPLTATITVLNQGAGTLTWSATESMSWADLSLTSGTAPATTTVTVMPTGLPAGVHQGAVTVTAPGANGSPVAIPVTLTLTGEVIEPPPVQPVLSVSPTQLGFTSVGGASPPSQTVTIVNAGQTGTLSWTAELVNAVAPGFTLSATAGTAPSALVVGVVPTPQTTTATLRITAPGAQQSPQDVALSLTVTAEPPIQLVEPKTGWVVAGSLALVALVQGGGV